MSPSPCHRCGSTNRIPYTYKPPPPPHKGRHICTPECVKLGLMCLNCRIVI